MRLTPAQKERLCEIEDGYKDWCGRDSFLERKGLIRQANYANGPFAEFTDAGCDAVDALRR